MACISLSIEAYPERYTRMREMGYDGNRLLRELEKNHPSKSKEIKADVKIQPPKLPQTGSKQSFKGLLKSRR